MSNTNITTTTTTTTNTNRCKNIETNIKNLSYTQLESLFKIVQKNKCEYTINNNGIFLNLSRLDSNVLNIIEQFINFCIESKKELDKYEKICKDLNENLDVKKDPFVTDIDHITIGICDTNLNSIDNSSSLEQTQLECENLQSVEIIKKLPPKMSSTMKYYLLKKKYSKVTQQYNINNMKYHELFKESPKLTT